MLQGKLKKKFEQWYFKNYCSSSLKFNELMPHHKQDVFGWFYKQKTAMQKGVIIEFLDSIGIECFFQIGINIKDGSRDGVDYSIYVKDKVRYSGYGKTRLEAFTNSLETICQLYDDGRF